MLSVLNELAVNKSGNHRISLKLKGNLISIDAEHNVLIVIVGKNMRKLLKSFQRNNKLNVIVVARLFSERNSYTVNRNNVQHIVADLKLAAHKRRLCVNHCAGILRLIYHTLDNALRHCEALFGVDCGNIGIIARVHTHNGQFRNAI